MSNTIFIAGGNPLTTKLIDYYHSRGKKIAAASFGMDSEGEEISEDGLLVTYPWIPGSSLSPKNILLQSSHDQGEPSRAFLVYNAGIAGGAFHQVSSAAIQRMLDQKVKSYIFFLKELIGQFIHQDGGTISVILQAEQGVLRDPICAGAYGMIRSLTTAALRAYEQENFQLSLYETEAEDIQGFIGYIIENQEEKGGNRIFAYPPKTGIFSLGSRKK